MNVRACVKKHITGKFGDQIFKWCNFGYLKKMSPKNTYTKLKKKEGIFHKFSNFLCSEICPNPKIVDVNIHKSEAPLDSTFAFWTYHAKTGISLNFESLKCSDGVWNF